MRRMRFGAAGALALLTATLILSGPGGDFASAAQKKGKKAAAAAVAQPAGGSVSDLGMVPADAVGFVHIKIADIWKDASFDQFRQVLAKAGPKALAALDSQFVPAPSSIDRATAFVTLGADKEPKVFGIIRFSAPFDEAKVAAGYLPKATKAMAGGKAVYTDKDLGVAVTFPDAQHILVGMPGALEDYIGKPVTRTGPLAAAIAMAGTKPVVAGANIAGVPIPPQAFEQVPPEVRPILMAQQVVVSLDFAGESKVEMKVSYKDAAAAGDAHRAIKALADMGRQEVGKAKQQFERTLFDPAIKTPRPPEQLPEAIGAVFALGAMNWIDEFLAEPPVKLAGSDLNVSVTLPRHIAAAGGASVAVGVGLLLPAVQKVREAAARSQSSNNLKQIGLALHNYHDVNGALPPPAITDKNGKPLLSWRVAILPYIEQDALYRQFKLDEPWDSPNNKPLSQMMIKTFVSPNATKIGPGLTNYVAVVGPGAAWEKGKKLRFVDFTDGTSNTVLVVETADAVEWAKPDADLVFDPKKLPKITPLHSNGFNTLFGDGSVRFIQSSLDPMALKAMFTRNGGEVIPFER